MTAGNPRSAIISSVCVVGMRVVVILLSGPAAASDAGPLFHWHNIQL